MRRSWTTPITRRRMVATASALTGATALGAIAPGQSLANALTHPAHEGETAVAYEIEGRLLEVCTCNVLCPCWVGEDPDGGTCDSVMGWSVDKGTIEGVDVSGLTLALSVHIPGNIFQGDWRAVVYVDDRSSAEQQEALLLIGQ